MERSLRLAVDCVITDEAGDIVLIRRKHEPFKDNYALPGGFVEVGETVEDACRREVKEKPTSNSMICGSSGCIRTRAGTPGDTSFPWHLRRERISRS